MYIYVCTYIHTLHTCMKKTGVSIYTNMYTCKYADMHGHIWNMYIHKYTYYMHIYVVIH